MTKTNRLWIAGAALCMMLTTIGLLCWASHIAGYKQAIANMKAREQYVFRKMDDIGFCGWAEDFSTHCQSSDGAKEP